jgi:hypothetical protein
MTEATDLATTVHGSPLTAQDAWWDEAADDVEGYDLLRDEALYDLVGVPFVGYKAVFRDGIQRKGAAYRDDYVSLELRVAPAAVIMRDIARVQSRRKSFNVPPLTESQALSLPGQQLVINDGSTGVYRQIMQYLVAKERITLPEGNEEGGKGDSIYDLPRSQWLKADTDETDSFNISLRCMRGLRFSDYENEYTGDSTARTWYIA